MRAAAWVSVCALSLALAACSSEESAGGGSGAGGQAGSAQAGAAGSAGGGAGGSSGSSQGGSSGSSAGGSTGGAAGAGGLPISQSCPSFGAGVSVGTVAATDITEASGLVASRSQAGLLWVHNDSGDSARVFAVSDTGADRGSFALTGAAARDWEDMALGPGPEAGQAYLYLGDIGDNAAAYSSVTLYRVAEPAAPAGGGEHNLSGVVALEFEYPDGAHNAEALLSDPITGDLLIVTKGLAEARIYRAAAPHNPGRRTLTYEGNALGVMTQLVTGGDVSAQGQHVVLRTYSSVRIYLRNAGMSVADALQTEPCEVPSAAEGQGETVAFSPDGLSYFTLSEGTSQPLYRFTRTN